jgi:hypothetical protein
MALDIIWVFRHLAWPFNQMIPVEIEPRDPKVIVSLGYGITEGPNPQLSEATKESLEIAIQWANHFPYAFVVFGNSSHTGLNDNGALEEQLKWKLVDELGFPRERVMSVGPITNTITEAEAVHKILVVPEDTELLLITVAIHGAPFVYYQVFKKEWFSLQYIKDPGYQEDHALKNQKGAFRWLLATEIRNVLVLLFAAFHIPLSPLAKIGVHKKA